MLVRPCQRPGIGRRLAAGLLSVLGTIVWTHGLAALVRSFIGLPVEALAPVAGWLTLAAGGAAVVGSVASRRPGVAGALAGAIGAVAIGFACPVAFLPALALIPSGVAFAALGAWFAQRLPDRFDELPATRPRSTTAWLLIALLALVQVGRLSTYMTNSESDWFLSTRDPFYAKHECLNAYVHAAELDRRGESNVYDATHYPGLNRDAEPVTELSGMAPEDPFQYAPQFLLWPRAAIAITQDYQAIRLVWFGINVTLCMAAVLMLAFWIGGRVGAVSGLLSPLLLAAFPSLHNFQYGQFHFATIALAVLGMLAFACRRPAIGGTLLAVSILSKLFPALLLFTLAAQRRWRDLTWSFAAIALITLATLRVTGTAPFLAFAEYHLPRLVDGSAFAFGEAWPEVAGLLIAGNQGISGIFDKLTAMGLPISASISTGSGKVYGLTLVLVAVWVGLRGERSRTERAVAWVGLLGLGSLASTGAWADYVPVTCVWLLTLLAPLAIDRPATRLALGLCAVMQVFLLGTMPLGDWVEISWMYPASLLGALSMLATFTVGVALHELSSSTSHSTPAGRTAATRRGLLESRS
ncbi:MAG: glycosyltransferase family 87 protein [Myxococcales bacterium]